jgi:hypothetical protein
LHAEGKHTDSALLHRAELLGDTLAAAQRCVDALDEVRRRPSLATTASFQLEADKAITAATEALAAYFAASAAHPPGQQSTLNPQLGEAA